MGASGFAEWPADFQVSMKGLGDRVSAMEESLLVANGSRASPETTISAPAEDQFVGLEKRFCDFTCAMEYELGTLREFYNKLSEELKRINAQSRQRLALEPASVER